MVSGQGMGKIHMRKSIRLKGYDYSLPGAYFLTIGPWDRVCLFGEVAGGEIRLSAFGGMVREEWFKTAEIRPYVDLPRDEFVVMPNHVHGIMWILDDGVGARRRRAPTTERFGAPVSGSIPTIVRAFKSASTRRMNEERGKTGVPL